MKSKIILLSLVFGLTGFLTANAEIQRSEYAEDNLYITVLGEDWHPDGFEHGMSVPATYLEHANIRLDGVEDESEWGAAAEVVVPLEFGTTEQALVKVLYTGFESTTVRCRSAGRRFRFAEFRSRLQLAAVSAGRLPV